MGGVKMTNSFPWPIPLSLQIKCRRMHLKPRTVRRSSTESNDGANLAASQAFIEPVNTSRVTVPSRFRSTVSFIL